MESNRLLVALDTRVEDVQDLVVKDYLLKKAAHPRFSCFPPAAKAVEGTGVIRWYKQTPFTT